MRKFSSLCCFFVIASFGAEVSIAKEPTYAGQESRNIKALSDSQVSGYLSGKGMGLAKAAELNGYPGPKHVLDLADELQLSAEQREQSLQLFGAMQSKARRLGQQLVDLEKSLDSSFANNQVTQQSLAKMLGEIGRIQAEIRATHLAAHIQQREILSQAQIASYNRARGYDGGESRSTNSRNHQHSHH